MLCSFSLQLIFFSEQPFYGNYSTLDSHTNTVISHRLPTRQDGVENRDKVYFKLTETDLVLFDSNEVLDFKDMAPVSSIFCNFRCDPLLVGESVRRKQATSQQLRETSSDFVRFFLCIRCQRREPIGFERTDSKTCSGSYLQNMN